jgi:hypothetical protein
VCTAKPNADQRFTCYDIAPDTDLASYFENYLQDVESFGGCDEEILLNNSTDNNNSTLLGHTTSSMLYTSAWGTVLADSRLDENFDPLLAASLSINTLLIDDAPDSASSIGGLLLSSSILAITFLVSIASISE